MTGIVQLPPVVVDENDIIVGASCRPRRRGAHGVVYYAWQGLRLEHGARDVDRADRRAAHEPRAQRLPTGHPTLRPDPRPGPAVDPAAGRALALFGLAAAIAAIALGGLGISRLRAALVDGAAHPAALGMTHRNAPWLFAFDAFLAIAAGLVVAALISVVVSPLWPLGSIHVIAPDTGVHADLTVLLGGGGLLLLALLAVASSRPGAPPARGRRTERVRPSQCHRRGRSVGFGSPACSAPTSRSTAGLSAVGSGAPDDRCGRGVGRGGGRGDRVRRRV